MADDIKEELRDLAKILADGDLTYDEVAAIRAADEVHRTSLEVEQKPEA